MSHSDAQLFAHIFDETLKRAFARSLEIIGEVVKNLSPTLLFM